MKKIILLLFYILLFSVNNILPQSGWIKQKIGFDYDGFNIIHFFNQNYGYAVSDYSGYPGYYGRFFTTYNGGQNWAYTNFNSPDTYLDSYFFDESNFVFVGNRGLGFGIVTKYTNFIRNDFLIPPTMSGAYMTFIGGTDWINTDTGFIVGNDFGPGGAAPRALKTLNHGNNWIEITPPINIVSQAIQKIKLINYNIIYCLADYKLIKTTNSGLNWEIVSSIINDFNLNLVTKDTFYVFGYSGNVRISSDTGHTWDLRPVGHDIRLNSIEFLNSKTGWVCGDSGYIFKTTNAGLIWQNQYSGTSAPLLKIFLLDENNLWIGADSGIVLKTTTGGITFINNQQNEIVNLYKLYQNYPNPFNITTKIKFDIANPPFNKGGQRGFVSLTIYDITGKEVATLVNESLQPGTYEVIFNAKNLNSGVYFYALTADNNRIETKKILLIK